MTKGLVEESGCFRSRSVNDVKSPQEAWRLLGVIIYFLRLINNTAPTAKTINAITQITIIV